MYPWLTMHDTAIPWANLFENVLGDAFPYPPRFGSLHIQKDDFHLLLLCHD
jgi:hypothetical protein